MFRYIVTLGGLIGTQFDGDPDVSTPSGIKKTFQRAREEWTQQYSKVREAVAQLMMVLEQKRSRIEKLNREAEELKLKMADSVDGFKRSKDENCRKTFTDLFGRNRTIAAEQEQLNREINDLRVRVESYQSHLGDMQKRIEDLQKQEADAIADIVGSQQIVKLNERLGDVSTELDDASLAAVEQRRQTLVAKAEISGQVVRTAAEHQKFEAELYAAANQSEADEAFAAMVAEKQDPGSETTETPPQSQPLPEE